MTLSSASPGVERVSRRWSLVAVLRDAAWLTEARARRFTRIWLVISLLMAAAWLALSKGDLDPLGKPLGTDFVSFWIASKMALGGHAAQVYDLQAHRAVQARQFGPDVGYFAFFYPPIYLLICLPLALAPYLAALGGWLGLTGAAYVRVARAFCGEAATARRIGWLAILAFPAVLTNVGHGQNGFLSLALFGGGVLLLDRRPLIAGLLLGCLVYKPHLGLLIPIALIAAGRWRTVLSAACTVIAAAALSLWVFGGQVWSAFLASSAIARAALEQNAVGNERMQSVFAAVRLLHGSLMLAYGAQAMMAAAVCAALIFAQRRAFRASAEGPALVTAALLASPFLLDYDLILLAIPLAWLTVQGLRGGFWPWEKSIIAAAYILPAVSRSLATATGLPIGPLVMAAVFWLVMRRWIGRAASASKPSIADLVTVS